MATAHIVLQNTSARADTGGTLPIPDSAVVSVATLTSSGTSQLSGITAAGPAQGLAWNVTASGGKLWVTMGAGTPVAASGAGWLVLDGQSRDFAVTVESEKLAIKDA